MPALPLAVAQLSPNGIDAAILKQAEAGAPVPELCREHGMSSATFYKWRSKFGGMDASLMARIEWRGKPRTIRCDNGPEYISGVTAQWAKKHGIDCIYPARTAAAERLYRAL